MKNLNDYIFVEKIFESSFCDEILSLIKEEEWVPHLWNTYTRDSNSYREDELESAYFFDDRIHTIIMNSIGKMVVEKIPESRVFGITNAKLNRYKVGMSMKKHADHIYSLFEGSKRGIPIISTVTALNDEEEYKGGDFIFTELDKTVRLKKGEVLIFPSLFIYEHCVTTVTKGIRYTAVNWLF